MVTECTPVRSWAGGPAELAAGLLERMPSSGPATASLCIQSLPSEHSDQRPAVEALIEEQQKAQANATTVEEMGKGAALNTVVVELARNDGAAASAALVGQLVPSKYNNIHFWPILHSRIVWLVMAAHG